MGDSQSWFSGAEVNGIGTVAGVDLKTGDGRAVTLNVILFQTLTP